MSPLAVRSADPRATLAKALINAGKTLGLSQEALGHIIGRDRSALYRGLDPESKPGELALLLIRVYRSLYVLVGGGEADMRHWINTYNHDLQGIPAEQLQHVQGLIHVVDYLDAMRGKV